MWDAINEISFWCRQKRKVVCTLLRHCRGEATNRVVAPLFLQACSLRTSQLPSLAGTKRVQQEGSEPCPCGVFVAEPVVMVVMEFLERTWPWPMEHLEDIPHYDPQMSEIGRGVQCFLPAGVFHKLRHVGISRVVLETRYFPVRAFPAISCSVSVCCSLLTRSVGTRTTLRRVLFIRF